MIDKEDRRTETDSIYQSKGWIKTENGWRAPNYAWVISGGGARIVQALDLIEKHLESGGEMPDFIVGTSAGGLLAFLISRLGMEGARREILKIERRQDLFQGHFLWGLGKLGLWNSKPLQKLMERVAIENTAKIPYYTCSYDIRQTKLRYFDQHTIGKMTASTACIPILVEPVYDFVDGGLTENTPLQFPIDLGATKIDVFMCSAEEKVLLDKPKTKIGMALRCLEAMRLEIAKDDVKTCLVKNEVEGYDVVDVKLHVPERNVLDTLDFDFMSNAYRILNGIPELPKKRIRPIRRLHG